MNDKFLIRRLFMTASEIYNELTLYFWQEEEPVFPETYAGAFLEDSGDFLVILVTEDNEETREYYFDIVGAEAPIIFRAVNYSYNYLLNVGESALNHFTAPIWSGIDVEENFFNIILDKNYPESILEYETFSLENLPIVISFSEQVEPIIEILESEIYHQEEVFIEEVENSWTLIILVTTFVILVFYSFFVVRKKSK